jgi:hypothetical protein
MRRVAVAGIAVMVAAGAVVATTQAGGKSTTAPTASSPHFARPVALTADTPAGLDRAMLRAIPPLASAARSARPPSPLFRHPPTTLGIGPEVVRARWWTIRKPWRVVRHRLIAHRPIKFRGRFDITTLGPRYTDASSEGHWNLWPRPLRFAHAEVEPLVAPLDRRTTGIGLYAIAVDQPPRPPAEIVPVGAHVEVTLQPKFDRPATVQGPVTGAEADEVISTFDHLRVSTELGPYYECPALLGGIRRIGFTASGHTWTLDFHRCGLTDVTRDGQSLPGLQGMPYLPQPFAETFWVPTGAVEIHTDVVPVS